MITEQLISPKSIAVTGASNNLLLPGGGIIKNLIINDFRGAIYAVNSDEQNVQGLAAYNSVSCIPDCDLAIIADDDDDCVNTIGTLLSKKECKAVIICAGHIMQKGKSEEEARANLQMLAQQYGASVIGPNSAGVVTPDYSGMFTGVQNKSEKGIDIISSSRSTIAFLVESAEKYGLDISSIFSVGYSYNSNVEDILEWMDKDYDTSSRHRIIAIYLETITNPKSLLIHSRSLIKKGARIVAIKGGCNDEEIQAGVSHTGMLASPTKAVGALFAKCGIIRAYEREEMMAIAGILSKPIPKGKNIAILTQAGGSAIILSDYLSNKGIKVKNIFFEDYVFGKNAGQMSSLLDKYNDNPDIDGIAVVFGYPGISDSAELNNMLFRKIKNIPKPVYPIFPSLKKSEMYINEYHKAGGITFDNEVVFGRAITDVLKYLQPVDDKSSPAIDKKIIRKIIDESPNGWMPPFLVQQILDASGIGRVKEIITSSKEEASKAAIEIGYPVAMKIIGPVHKIDVDGVSLNVSDEHTLRAEFERMTNIEGVSGILIQPMLSGTEVFIGAKREKIFGPMIVCGLGGIFVEVIKDFKSTLAPVSQQEAENMIRSLKGYPIIKGYRGQPGISEILFAETIRRVSSLCMAAPEITEMDINPLIGNEKKLTAVDARIRIVKTQDLEK